MPDKQKTLEFLEECLRLEESVIPLYSRHIDNTLFLSGFDKAEREKISRILNKLRSDSMRHRKIFAGLVKKIKGSDKDVY